MTGQTWTRGEAATKALEAELLKAMELDVHVLLVNSDNEERRRLKLSLEALGYVVSGAASFPVAQRLLREHAGDYHAVLVDHKLRAQGVPAHRSAVWAAPHTACVDLLSWARGVAALKEVAFIVTADEVGASPPLYLRYISPVSPPYLP